MKPTPTAANIRQFLLNRYSAQLNACGVKADSIGDDFDLLEEGIIDSLGILEMVGGIEAEFGYPIDLEALDAGDLTRIGPLSKYVEAAAPAGNPG